MLLTSPSSIDGFTRFMTEAYDERDMIGVSTGGLAFFGRPEAGGSKTYFSPDALVVDIDIVRGNERLAALVPRGSITTLLGPNQRNTDDVRFSNIARSFPLSVEAGNVNANQILQRIPGEAQSNSGVTKYDRMRSLAMRQINENKKRHIRLFEYLAWQSLLTGKQDSILGDASTQYDFYRAAGNDITVGTPWDNVNATIMSDIDDLCKQIRIQGKATADMVVIGSEALEAAVENAKLAAIADNRRFELIEINDKMPVPDRFAPFIAGGMIARGRLMTASGYELWVFTYNEIYNDAAGDAQYYMPQDEAFICSSKARADRYFGPSEKLPPSAAKAAWYMERFGIDIVSGPMLPDLKAAPGVIAPGMFYHCAWESDNETTITIESQAAPIFATNQTDGFGRLQGLITP